MELDFAVLADGVTHRPDGKLDIYGAGFDTIFAPAVPATHPRLMVVARILVTLHEASQPHRFDIDLQSADGQVLAQVQREGAQISDEQLARIPAGGQAGFGLIVNFENIVFPEYGSYQLIIRWDGNEVRDPLRLIVAEPPTTA